MGGSEGPRNPLLAQGRVPASLLRVTRCDPRTTRSNEIDEIGKVRTVDAARLRPATAEPEDRGPANHGRRSEEDAMSGTGNPNGLPLPENEREDPFDIVYSAQVDREPTGEVTRTRLADVARRYEEEPEPKSVEGVEAPRERDKVHPVLRVLLGAQDANARAEVVVVFDDPVTVPRFPEPVADEPRDSERNALVQERCADLVRSLQQDRADGYERVSAELAELGATVVERFWLINGVLAELPLGAVESVAARDDVVSVEPRHSGEVPPQDEVDDGRARIVSDPYFDLGQTAGFIGLLDTGVRFSHTLFNNPTTIAFRRDCNNGGADCNTGSNLNPNDDCWNHGTSSAAIITGNGNQGNDFRGVTAITLDSFKVYATANPCQGLDEAAAIRGFQAAVAVADRVLVAEMQGGGDHDSALAQAADAAFDAGAVVIAANGNNGPNFSTVNCPANARRAIGVGNFDVQTLDLIASQSRGPTADNRVKPDIQAPTNTETASNASDTARQVFTGTSGATPYAAGAAALLRNWLRGGPFDPIDPGQVYAQLILSGQRPNFDNIAGAGPLSLPVNSHAWWGKTTVSNGQTLDIAFGGAASAEAVNAAIWWPESGTHNDIDLRLVRVATGAVEAFSVSTGSVFERCRVSGGNAGGDWLVRVNGFNVPSGSQTVYFAMTQGQ
ncbi:S8 family serine peptidase [Streptomyces sp. NPDC020412]|uniref:S8 family serine peptidase n=1 Tax=Streptomyces sp. NPDC020412 TaxID=3365073 RepID=UPI00378C10D0